MAEKSVGVVVISKFLISSNKKFKKYINYMGRDEAIRNEYFNRYSIYEDYMGNPEKTTGLFDFNSNCMSKEEKEYAQKLFEQAQQNGSVMWQDVFSFDNKWLEEQGLYDPLTGSLDENKIKNAVRKAIDYSLEKKDMKDTAIWNGAIHYNTDNIHIHVAICEPNPKTTRGKRTQKTLDKMKSVFVNELLNSRENYKDINSSIRNEIIDSNKKVKDKKLKRLAKKVIKNLPDDKRQWHYGYNTMKEANKYLDEMTQYYIKTYKRKEYEELLEKLDKQEQILKEAYGEGGREKYKDYKQNKIDELYQRMGNAFLTEIKNIQLENKKTYNKPFKKRYNKTILSKKDINRINKALGNEVERAKNISYYEQLQQKIDRGMSI